MIQLTNTVKCLFYKDTPIKELVDVNTNPQYTACNHITVTSDFIKLNKLTSLAYEDQ